MQQFLTRRRWVLLLAGAAVQALTGLPSAWGALQKPLTAQYALDGGQAAWAFSILLACYGVGCAAGGFFQDKYGPRPAGLAGTALLCGGLVGAGWLPAGRPWLLWLCFAAPAGLGSAFLYPAVQSCAQKWYTDKKGLAAGAVGLGVGLSGLVLTGLVRLFEGRGWGLRGLFFTLAGLTAAVCLLACTLLTDPPAAAPARKKPPAAAPGRMLRTKDYWLLAGALALSTPSVQLFGPMLVEMAAARGLPEQAGLWAVMAGSLGNGLGRLGSPMRAAKIGCRAADLWLFAGLAALSAGLWLAPGWWLVAVYAGLCVCYSGLAAVLPVFAGQRFGQAHLGVNLGLLALGQTAGSLVFPLLAQWLGLAQTGRHLLAIAAAAAGWLLVRQLKE